MIVSVIFSTTGFSSVMSDTGATTPLELSSNSNDIYHHPPRLEYHPGAVVAPPATGGLRAMDMRP